MSFCANSNTFFLKAESVRIYPKNLQPREHHKCRENFQRVAKKKKKKKHTLHSAPCFSKPLSSRSHTHKHIGTNTYTSKQRCHFTQEGSAVLSIRQGLVLGQRLLPNLRPPSPGSTGPLWPPPPRRQAPHCSSTTNK